MTYFSLSTRMQKKPSCQKVFRMISSAPDLKHILQKLNILGQRQIIQPVPVVSDCLGHFVPIYFTPFTQAQCGQGARADCFPIIKRQEQLAGFTQLLEVVATSTGQLEGFTGQLGPAGGPSQAQEVWQELQPFLARVGRLEELGGLVETGPAKRNRWSRLSPHFGQPS